MSFFKSILRVIYFRGINFTCPLINFLVFPMPVGKIITCGILYREVSAETLTHGDKLTSILRNKFSFLFKSFDVGGM